MGADLDTLETIARFEQELMAGSPRDRCLFLLAILARWQVDPDLTPASRARAGDVHRRFSESYQQ